MNELFYYKQPIHDWPSEIYQGKWLKTKALNNLVTSSKTLTACELLWKCPDYPTKNHLNYSPHVTKATTMGNSFTEILFNTLPFPQSLPAFYTVGSLETSSKPSPSWHIHDEQLQLLRHWAQLPLAVPLILSKKTAKNGYMLLSVWLVVFMHQLDGWLPIRTAEAAGNHTWNTSLILFSLFSFWGYF